MINTRYFQLVLNLNLENKKKQKRNKQIFKGRLERIHKAFGVTWLRLKCTNL